MAHEITPGGTTHFPCPCCGHEVETGNSATECPNDECRATIFVCASEEEADQHLNENDGAIKTQLPSGAGWVIGFCREAGI